ncbi:MAG: hypothetical protein O2931_07670, partial [Planctomycetota bacterium]|nr:hypothetical protein [Planctomycetota bacterium]
MNNRTTSRAIILLALLALAGLLRFYNLGSWAFAGDETATLAEVEVLFEGKPAPEQSQKYRLPRIIPLSYLIQHVGTASFGRDEFGSRVM